MIIADNDNENVGGPAVLEDLFLCAGWKRTLLFSFFEHALFLVLNFI